MQFTFYTTLINGTDTQFQKHTVDLFVTCWRIMVKIGGKIIMINWILTSDAGLLICKGYDLYMEKQPVICPMGRGRVMQPIIVGFFLFTIGFFQIDIFKTDMKPLLWIRASILVLKYTNYKSWQQQLNTGVSKLFYIWFHEVSLFYINYFITWALWLF